MKSISCHTDRVRRIKSSVAQMYFCMGKIMAGMVAVRFGWVSGGRPGALDKYVVGAVWSFRRNDIPFHDEDVQNVDVCSIGVPNGDD